jgi:hypothetical protein
MPRESMLGIAFRAGKNVLSFFTAKATFSSHFRGMGFIFGHRNFLLEFRYSLFKYPYGISQELLFSPCPDLRGKRSSIKNIRLMISALLRNLSGG